MIKKKRGDNLIQQFWDMKMGFTSNAPHKNKGILAEEGFSI